MLLPMLTVMAKTMRKVAEENQKPQGVECHHYGSITVATAILVHKWAHVAAPAHTMHHDRLWTSNGACPATIGMRQCFGPPLSIREGYTGMATARLSLVIPRR